jgi:DNA replicative helicase MCM subunit Mcm2 (Cdc46/Mcm family)
MTTKRRTYIELGDIIAIDYECRHCGSRCSVPIAKFDRKVDKCPNCNQDWLPVKAEAKISDEQAVSLFIERLKDVQNRRLGATLRLEVNPEQLD